MVLENGIVSDAKEVGPYAGFIESTFAAMNLITGTYSPSANIRSINLLCSHAMVHPLRSLGP